MFKKFCLFIHFIRSFLSDLHYLFVHELKTKECTERESSNQLADLQKDFTHCDSIEKYAKRKSITIFTTTNTIYLFNYSLNCEIKNKILERGIYWKLENSEMQKFK